MPGVVSLLDEQHAARVEGLWAGLEREFGLRGIFSAPFPHFSYHVAERYDSALLEPLLDGVAAGMSAFTVRTDGLGVFPRPVPVIFLPVVRSPALCRFHDELWPQVSATCAGNVEYYHPERWIPHITLAYGDIPGGQLGDILRFLGTHDLDWEIPVDNVAFVTDAESGTAAPAPIELHTAGAAMRRFMFGKT